MVSFEYEPKLPAYGVILWMEGDIANVDFKNPVTLEHEIGKKNISELRKIGTL